MESLRPALATKLKSESFATADYTDVDRLCLYLLSKPLAMVTCVSSYALEHPGPTEQAVFIVSENSKMDELQECCKICPKPGETASGSRSLRGKLPLISGKRRSLESRVVCVKQQQQTTDSTGTLVLASN